VLSLMAEGLPNKAICQRLNLTEHTVKSHIKALFQHLSAHTRTECVRIASRSGLLD
jgi:DNA-binding NarL/FixJ family response regulator